MVFLVEKKSLEPDGKLTKKPCVSISEKSLKLNKKTRRKTDYLLLCRRWKTTKTLLEKWGRKPDIDWKIGTKLWVNSLSTTFKFEATKSTTVIPGAKIWHLNFCFFCWLPYSSSYIFFSFFRIKSLAIDRVESSNREFPIGLSGCSL